MPSIAQLATALVAGSTVAGCATWPPPGADAKRTRQVPVSLEDEGEAAPETLAHESWSMPPLPQRSPAMPPVAGPSQVAVWRAGKQVALIERTEAQDAGLVVLDVGSDWVPALFRSTRAAPHAYEDAFVALANGRFADTAEGRRARRDRYLELYGIPPSPALLSSRFARLDRLACTRNVPSGSLVNFRGAVWGEKQQAPDLHASVVSALQRRLRCEGHFRRRPTGRLDGWTRAALEEFERRNRIYARGALDGETLSALHAPPLELERRALVRAITERVILDQGLIEDGSAQGVRPAGELGARLLALGTAPNMVARAQAAVVEALGLSDVGGTREFYRRLAPVLTLPHYGIAIPALKLPRYHKRMEFFVEIDRGDIYYDFPKDEAGQPVEQPVERRPTLTLFAGVGRPVGRGERAKRAVVPLAHYGTTIGGWRKQHTRGRDVWSYKESPSGPRVWSRIVSAPVWLPPAGVPPKTLVYQTRRGADGDVDWEVNENLVGPGYASAYGLVAAYHQKYERRGKRRVPTDDEGIRSHGSSDYTSIWQRASLGCHRLHNHLAVRLFNFILMHSQHRRRGHRTASFSMPVEVPGFATTIEVTRTGYAFELRDPIYVEVLRGRVMGERRQPPKKVIDIAPES